jgi:hypothetical protein
MVVNHSGYAVFHFKTPLKDFVLVEFEVYQMIFENKRRSPLGICRRNDVPAAVPEAYSGGRLLKAFRGISSPLGGCGIPRCLDSFRDMAGRSAPSLGRSGSSFSGCLLVGVPSPYLCRL